MPHAWAQGSPCTQSRAAAPTVQAVIASENPPVLLLCFPGPAHRHPDSTVHSTSSSASPEPQEGVQDVGAQMGCPFPQGAVCPHSWSLSLCGPLRGGRRAWGTRGIESKLL